MNNFPPGSGNNSSEKLPTLHLDFLDGLRAIAALYVMSHHAWLTVFYADRRPTLLQSSFTYWLNYGHFAVDLFIVLCSLYLIHMPLLQTFWQFVLVPMHLSNFGKLVLLCLCGGPLIVFCSFLFFLAFERPFISNRRIINSNDLAAGVALSPAP